MHRFLAQSFARLASVMLIAGLSAAGARAQCATAATGLTTTTGVCSTRLTWTPGANVLVQQVRRGTTADFASSLTVAVVSATTSTYTDTTPITASSSFYWIVSVPVNVSCATVGSSSAFAERPYAFGTTALVPTVTSGCSSTTIVGTPVFDASSYQFLRKVTGSDSAFDVIAELPVTTWIDLTGTPGVVYRYAVLPIASCGSAPNVFVRDMPFGGRAAFTSGASGVSADVGGIATLSTTSFAANNTTWRWTKDGVPVFNDVGISGATTTQLTINPVRWRHAGEYRLVGTTPCGMSTGETVFLVVRENPCRADFDESGQVAAPDIFEFLNAWFAGCP